MMQSALNVIHAVDLKQNSSELVVGELATWRSNDVATKLNEAAQEI